MFIAQSFKDFSFCLELITINSVLATLRFNLLALSQPSIYFRSLMIFDSRSGIVAAEKVTLVSSQTGVFLA